MLASTVTRRFCDLSRDELHQWCQGESEPPYRADQIRQWLFRKRVSNFDAMRNLSAPLRTQLSQSFQLFSSRIVEHQVARDRTEKLLVQLDDGNHVECVLMREPKRRTVCLSTQVGCAMGCVFCASGMLGLRRNLSTGEILEQVLHLDRLLAVDERITNVVVMGIGEPLANLRALLPALDTLGEPGALGLGARRTTISTVGLPDKMRQLARAGKPYNLAVSLHAPSDELRDRLVPINQRIGLAEVLDAADDYFQQTGRRVTYEYVLLSGVNDEPDHARQLAALLRGRHAHVNLIPMNPVAQFHFHEPSSARSRQFATILEQAGIVATVRKRKGADIDAACGQLRLEHDGKSPNL